MQGRNIALYIIILALTAMAILFLMYQTRRIDANLYNSQVEANTEELIASTAIVGGFARLLAEKLLLLEGCTLETGGSIEVE